MQVYAAGYDRQPTNGRGWRCWLAGIGLSAADSEDAIRTTPPAVSLAISPYAIHPDALLATARSFGHETLVSIPMEPQNFPLNDPGNEALLTNASPAANAQRLDWALSRHQRLCRRHRRAGPAARRAVRGRAAPALMAPVLDELARRGVALSWTRAPARPRATWRCRDAAAAAQYRPGDRRTAGARGDRGQTRPGSEQLAHDRGAAIGLVSTPLPVTTGRIAAWAATLSLRGLQLVPVSAVVAAAQP